MKKDCVCRIRANQRVSAGHYHLTLAAPGLARQVRPGQFAQVLVNTACHPLLRRPLSILGVRTGSGRVSFLYRVVGQGTALLAGRTAGETVEVLGPLGKGFTVDRNCRTALLVAGGMGIAPLSYLAERLLAKKVKVRLLFGQVKRDRRLEKTLLAPCRAAGARVQLASEKKDKGCFTGRVTDLAARLLTGGDLLSGALQVFACGPWPMYRSLKAVLAARNLDCQVSLESRLACGFGACLGCAVKRAGQEGYALVCKDGPVFSIHEIDFNAPDQIHGN